MAVANGRARQALAQPCTLMETKRAGTQFGYMWSRTSKL